MYSDTDDMNIHWFDQSEEKFVTLCQKPWKYI